MLIHLVHIVSHIGKITVFKTGNIIHKTVKSRNMEYIMLYNCKSKRKYCPAEVAQIFVGRVTTAHVHIQGIDSQLST